MGSVTSFEFVPSDYKIRYTDGLNPSNISSLDGKNESISAKKIRVLIPSKLIAGKAFKDLYGNWFRALSVAILELSAISNV